MPKFAGPMQNCGRMLRNNVPAAELTTLAVGGPIATVIEVASETELLDALRQNPGALCIGGGSNLLVSDDGFDGVVIRSHHPAAAGFSVDGNIVRVEAPMDWDSFVQATITHGLQGMEATSGVPGSFGGAIVQNLGAYGQEIGETVMGVNVWDTVERDVRQLSKEECRFSYRDSLFKHDAERRYVVLSAHLRLQIASTAVPRYGDVSRLLAERTGSEGPYPLSDIRDAVLDVRRSKGMLLGASLPSAGSFFTNPVLNPAQVDHLAAAGLKTYMRSDGAVLTSAAALIQQAGFERGYRLGNAALSELHVLALVNAGNATAADVINLARHIRDQVFAEFGVTLTPEPVTLGFDSDPFG
jgi:UDP-N-acetylmuramate dehydrogenase